MKKSIVSVLVALLMTTAFLSGCASTGGKNLASAMPVGVVSVISDGDILWHGEEKTGGLLDRALKKATADNEEISALLSRSSMLINDADAALRMALEGRQIKLVEEKTVLASTAYKNAKLNKLAAASDLIQPSGYRHVALPDAGFARTFTEQTGSQGILYIWFNFEKAMGTGVGKTGTMCAAVTISAEMFNASGKRIMSKSYYAESKDKIGVVAGIYDYHRFYDLMPQAINSACDKLAADFAKKAGVETQVATR